jgi:LacI family repressor for deo operon, udp, cdd, tsx, nupC, and nupG
VVSDIRDVAKAAGVSIATVSRYLHHPQKVRATTGAKVAAAIKTTGYRPNFLARNFRTNRSYALLVILPDIANPFFSEVIKGIESVASRHNYSVLLGDTSYQAHREEEYAQIAATKRADGLIQLTGTIPAQIETLVNAGSLPFVSACEEVKSFPTLNVGIDNRDAAKRLTKHLLALGHRKIGVITGPRDNQHTQQRMAGLKAAFAEEEDECSVHFVAEGDYSIRSGFNGISRYVGSDRPDAIFCFSDQMAIGALRRLREMGIKVPEDLSVAGFDDLEMASYTVPPLTTVSQPARMIGEEAAKLLFEQINGETPHGGPLQLAADIIVRESTAPRR